MKSENLESKESLINNIMNILMDDRRPPMWVTTRPRPYVPKESTRTRIKALNSCPRRRHHCQRRLRLARIPCLHQHRRLRRPLRLTRPYPQINSRKIEKVQVWAELVCLDEQSRRHVTANPLLKNKSSHTP